MYFFSFSLFSFFFFWGGGLFVGAKTRFAPPLFGLGGGRLPAPPPPLPAPMVTCTVKVKYTQKLDPRNYG